MAVVPGPEIREARTAQGITQAQLAAAMGVAQPMISQWENEERPMPWERFYDALAAIERITKQREREAAATRERAAAARLREAQA